MKKLQQFNDWRDEFLIELSTILLLIGFIMGTIDLYVRGGFTVTIWYSLPWAAVQAVGIDGLFFAVWSRISKTAWQQGQRARLAGMLFVGIVLAIVATIINGVLGYQQITGIGDSLAAMEHLGISPLAFTWTRAILVVAVALLVQLFCRGKRTEIAKPAPETAPATPEIAGISGPKTEIHEILAGPGLLQLPAKPAISDEAILQFLAEHPEMKQKEIALRLAISESRISRLKKREMSA